MMDTQTLLALTGFAMAASWTPRPNNIDTSIDVNFEMILRASM